MKKMKSPLKAKPLRNPGDSVQERIEKVLFEEALPYFLAALFLVAVAVVEWWRWYFDLPPSPRLYSLMALVGIAVATFRILKAKRELKHLKQGRDGEKVVGQYLERLRETGAHIFHDVPGEGFNLDHVIVHISGVFVVETKTYSKPDRGEAKILFDGKAISRLGGQPDNRPIIQVKAASRWLAELLQETTGRKFPIRAVVVFPGWYIQPTAEAKASDVWVLNPKGLPVFIANSKPQLSYEDVKLCSYHLSRAIRAR